MNMNVRGVNDDVYGRLRHAASHGRLEEVCELVDAPDASCMSENQGGLVLACAAAAGHVDVVRALISQERRHPVPANAHCGVALTRAAEHGHVDVVRALLDDPHHPPLVTAQGSQGLILAASNGHLDVVQELLHRGAPADAQHDLPLRNAVRMGHAAVVTALMHSPQNPARADETTRLLFDACEMGYVEVVKALKDPTAAYPARVCEEALRIAAVANQVGVVDALLQAPQPLPLPPLLRPQPASLFDTTDDDD